MAKDTNRTDQAALIKIIGSRLKEAREMNGLSQLAASSRLGYANSSKLAKVEGATDTNSVPIMLLLRAAKIYDVSIDWLFGLTSDWEVTQSACDERNFSQWLFEAWEKQRTRDMSLLLKMYKKFLLIQNELNVLAKATAEIESAMAGFRLIHPEFDEMRSSRLVGAIERGSCAAATAKLKIERFKLECRLAVKTEGNPQLEMLIRGG
ncbi:Helix-turn-helix transcriptional regulator [Gammaproteobacteria bacterium]